jgi:hypothetical protein
VSSIKLAEKVLRDLEDVARYYGRTICFKETEEYPCLEVFRELTRGGSVTGITVCNERNGLCIELRESTVLKVIELEGNEVFFQVDVGSFVKRGGVLAYIITGKGEVRSFRVQDEGYVIFIHEDPVARPMRYTVVLGSGGVAVREFRRE